MTCTPHKIYNPLSLPFLSGGDLFFRDDLNFLVHPLSSQFIHHDCELIMARKPTRGSIRQPFSASTNSKPNKSTSTSEPTKRKLKTNPAEAYTYLPTLPKRHRTGTEQNSLSHAEEALAKPRREPQVKKGKGKRNGTGDESEDEEDDMEERIRKVAMMIAGDDAGEVEEEESDIDSDEAWESGGSDEERWGDVFRNLEKGTGKKKVKEVVRKVSGGGLPYARSTDECSLPNL
jgi:hypothetical protein